MILNLIGKDGKVKGQELLKIKLRVLYMLGKHAVTELLPQQRKGFLYGY
jgi:hypothetical protein